MPIYEYKHSDQFCSLGKAFDVTQSVHDATLTSCPQCGWPVRKLISPSNINTPKTNTELRDQGFTKLVRREEGIYENVTPRDGESKVMYHDKTETYPNLKGTIKD